MHLRKIQFFKIFFLHVLVLCRGVFFDMRVFEVHRQAADQRFQTSPDMLVALYRILTRMCPIWNRTIAPLHALVWWLLNRFFLGDRSLSSHGTGRNCALPIIRVPSCSPVLDKILAPIGPEWLSSAGAGVWTKVPMAFPDSKSVLPAIFDEGRVWATLAMRSDSKETLSCEDEQCPEQKRFGFRI